MSDFYDNLELDIPEDLGEIEFLREHPKILIKLIERSRDKSLEPFIYTIYSFETSGGFSWEESVEGYDFWQDILQREDLNTFYERYPR